jgi:hypothetical protein
VLLVAVAGNSRSLKVEAAWRRSWVKLWTWPSISIVPVAEERGRAVLASKRT